ncbi:MAG: OmpA family protein [Saprospiraceae bacterium]
MSAQEFVLEKLPEIVNSRYDEITPVPSRDGRTLFFTRVGSPDFERTLFLDSVNLADQLSPEMFRVELASIFSEIGNEPIATPESSGFNQDVWIAKADSLDFKVVEHPSFPMNNALPNSLVAITPDPNAFYVINQFEPMGVMKKGFSLIRRLPDGGWTFPEPVEIKDYYTITSDVSLTMSSDGQILILSAERFDSKEMDLYVCFRESENVWSAPQHLGGTVNSERRETTPFLSEDNTTLFFSSNRGGGIAGANDIFMSRRLDDTWKNWSAPVRLTEPINSPGADDSQPYFNMTTGYLYFTSRRDGNSDVFRVQIAPPQPTEIVLKGRIINAQTGELVKRAWVNYGAEGSPKNVLESEDGYYTLKIPKGVRFELLPEKPGYTGKSAEAFFRRDYYFFQDYYVVDLEVNPLSVNEKIELRPIFFQQSKAVILEKSFGELDRLASILFENPTLEIRVEGHTDNNGREQDLVRLSEERAQSIKDFLVQKGVSAYRISVLGHGSTKPLTDNSTDELRAQNRRVEVLITKI